MTGAVEVCRVLAPSELADHSSVVAPGLLNALLVRDDGRAVRIVEVEAYGGIDDQASHARSGPTARNASMFEQAGTAYVYFSYGIHWCVNVVTGQRGDAQAVLVRAGSAVAGHDLFRSARPNVVADCGLANGPAKLAQALGLDRSFDGVDLLSPASPLRLCSDQMPPPARPGCTSRVGISREVDRAWRWFVPGHPSLSSGRPS